MIAISQFHVLSPRGDCIITRDFRRDSPSGTADKFFRRVNFWDGGAPPTFTIDGVQYIWVNKSGINFVFTAKSPVPPAWGVDLLNKLVKSFKDFCGVLSEESLRRNFILIYELIDEIIDSGYPQTTASEVLKLAIHSDAAELNVPPSIMQNPLSIIPQLRGMTSPSATVPSSANQRPIGVTSAATVSPTTSITVGGVTLPGSLKIPGLTVDNTANMKNEIFVDIIEKLNVIVNSTNGDIVKSSIDGSIQMKSYLSGKPGLRLCLNEDLVINTENKEGRSSSSSAPLQDVIFNECADLSEFDSNRVISLIPPDGEFVLMHYRIASVQTLPFRIYPSVTFQGMDRVDVQISVRADIPDQNYGSNIVVSIPVPEGTVRSASCDIAGVTAGGASSAEYVAAEHKIAWTIKKLPGGSEVSCRAKIHLTAPPASGSKSFGPVALQFEIPMYSLSNMQVKYLRIQDQRSTFGGSPGNSGGPLRWVRYVAQSQSYVFR